MDIKGLLKKLPDIKGLLNKKLIIIAASGAVFVILLVFALFFFMFSGGEENTAETEIENEKIQLNNVNYENMVVLKQFKWIALNERSYMGKLSVNISLELASEDKLDLVETHISEIRGFVRSTAAEMRWMELRTPEGKLDFKYVLLKKINSMFPDIVVRNLYLTHFIMR